MARQPAGKRPQDLRFVVGELLRYMGRHRLLLFAVAALVTISACANLLGTYMIRPVVNSLAGADISALVRGVAVTALIYSAGVLAAWGYTQTMVNMAQKVLFDIRRDLFAHIQTLPLRFFDTRRHGDVMSYFTNDVDTVSDALNNSFAMVIQSFIQIVGTLAMLFVLIWQPSLLVVGGRTGWMLFLTNTTLAVIGITLNAIDLKRFDKLSLVLYALMGWLVVLALRAIVEALPPLGIFLLAGGGVAYTAGIVFYKSQKHYMHFVWHLFVLAGSVLQYACIALYCV